MATPEADQMTTERMPKKTEILCMSSGKGGVGKTLFSSCLGYALARAGLRVLMIDGDLATDGLSLFLLGPKGIEFVESFEPSNTFAGVIANYSATGKLDFEVRKIYRNGPDDHGAIYDALISGRFLYGQGNFDSYLSSIPNVDRGTFRSAVRELFAALRRAGEYDYVVVDTRGGFSYESTDLCGLADSFLVVVEADPTSFYQTRNLLQRIDNAAGESGTKSVLRGFLVNKAVEGLSEIGDLDLSKVESSFRNALTREFPILKYSDTYPIPADLEVLYSYKDQMVPFLGAPASLFTYATLTAYSNIFQIVTSRWTKEQVQGWQGLFNSVAEAIKRRNEEDKQARKGREAEEAAIKQLREISAQNESRLRDQEALIEGLRKEVDLARAQAAAELSRASAVESLIRSVSSNENASAKPKVSMIRALLWAAILAGLAFVGWQIVSKTDLKTFFESILDPISTLTQLNWTTRLLDANNLQDGTMIRQGIRYEFTFNSIPPPESVWALKRITGKFAIKLQDVIAFDSAHFAGWGDLKGLSSLDLSAAGTSDISGARNLPVSLTSLDLGNDPITDAELTNLPRSLASLDLRSTRITDAGLKDLPRTLTSLDLTGDAITDAGVKDLPRYLTWLDLELTQITDAGVKDLPRSLTSLDLRDNGRITDAGLKDLPSSLTALDLSCSGMGGFSAITDAGLRSLPPHLTSLALNNNFRITDVGLKYLPRSLISLDLEETKITDAGLKELPRSLTSLDLRFVSGITDAGLGDLPRSLTSLNLANDPQITNAGLRVLPPSIKVAR